MTTDFIEFQTNDSILYRSVNGLFVIWDALVGLKFNKFSA